MHIYQQIKQNRLFSAIYILGSALSIASAMIVVVYLYVKLADIYPERDRTHIYEISDCNITTGGKVMNNLGWRTCELVEKALESCEGVEYFSRCIDDPGFRTSMVNPDDGTAPFEIIRKDVDAKFFKIYDFEILAGNLFTDDDVESGVSKTVISHRLAERLFGSVEEAVGQTVKIKNKEYIVCAVVREPSFLMQNTFAQAYLPCPDIAKDESANWLSSTGPYVLIVRVKDDKSGSNLIETVYDLFSKFTAEDVQHFLRSEDFEMTVSVRSITSKDFSMPAEFDWTELLRKYGFMVLILLIVPAINLGGMISGNMESRLPEMGVRKSFGAYRRKLLRSILVENFVFTSIGAVIGLVIAVVLVWGWKDWLFFLDDSIMADAPESVSVIITSDMLFAPVVFICAFLITFLLNLLAAMLPVWWSLRNPIVNSLAEKK